MKHSFIPSTDPGKQLWLQNFAAKLPTYATKYGITPAETTDIQDGSDSFTYYVNYTNQYNEFMRKLTQYKNELKDGVESGGSPSVVPVPPTTGVAPTAVPPGIFKRANNLAQVIKKRLNYTVADGNDMGIEGDETTKEDINEAKPVLKIVLVKGGHPEIQWVKKSMDALEIYVDRGTGQFAFLAIDTVPHYTDTFELPATGAAAWKYKAIYRYKDEQVGKWSDIYSVVVQSV